MVVAAGTLWLHLPLSQSLKDKRRVAKSLIQRIRNEFNVSVAEVDDQERWQSLVLGVACVSNSARYAEGQLEAVVRFVETQRPDVPLLRYTIDLY